MKQFTTQWLLAMLLITALFTACTKDDILRNPIVNKPGQSPADTTVTNPADTVATTPPVPAILKVAVKVGIQVGEVFYDSIPATVRLTTWDSSGAMQETSLALGAGTNRVELPSNKARYHFFLSKWGVSDEITLTRDQLREGQPITLGGSRQAKKLKLEERFTINSLGESWPQAKTIYQYDASNRLVKITYFQKMVQYPDLRMTLVDKFVYSGNKVQRIDRYGSQDTAFAPTSFTEFTYDAAGRISHMHSTESTETFASVEYSVDTRHDLVTVDYLFSNGGAVENTMKFLGGNKVQYAARSSRGDSEGGSYTYDFNINPYIHMAWPDMWFRHSSKNNEVKNDAGYSGAYPSTVPYKIEYTYDGDGYPTTQFKSYKSYPAGEHLYTTKTVYTY